MSAPVVCSVGTSDPWNAAGIGLDARVFDAFGVRGVTVVAAVSAQDAGGVHALVPIDVATIDAQFAGLVRAGIAAYRIGALADVASATAIAAHLANDRVPAIYDPVLAPTGGGRFADAAALRAMSAALAPNAALLTPNLAEARAIAGIADADPATAARAILALGARAVFVTGIGRGVELVDTLYTAHAATEFAGVRLPHELRGTGCMLAASIAACLALGDALVPAIERARAFVRERIADGESLGGMRLMRLSP